MKNHPPLNVGAVSYLNTKPLVYDLAERAPYARVEFDLPSRLSAGLARGRFDVALIPSIDYFHDPSYSIVSDACIACRGPVLSVKLFSRVPMQRIRSLALDEGSRTSAALVRILLLRRFGITPDSQPLPVGADPVSAPADAVLLIGDRAIHPPGGEFVAEWDLGDEWCRWAELPFVFAMWVARGGVDPGDLAVALEETRDAGVRQLPAIADREAGAVGLATDACLTYLRDNLYFYLGTRERRGLELFRQHASRLGLVPRTQRSLS
jgi:chorismate dehydratase